MLKCNAINFTSFRVGEKFYYDDEVRLLELRCNVMEATSLRISPISMNEPTYYVLSLLKEYAVIWQWHSKLVT